MKTNTEIKFYKTVDGVVTIKAGSIELAIFELKRGEDAHVKTKSVIDKLMERTYNVRKDNSIVADAFNTGTHCIHKNGSSYYLLQTSF
jgi:hypothetical protein